MDMVIFLGSFALFFLVGMPIAVAMLSSSLLYCIVNDVNLAMMGTQMFTGLNNFALIAIPMFILCADVMDRTSVSDRIFKFCNDLVGYIPGGLGHVNVVCSIIFAGMSGSAVADAGGIGNMEYEAMVNEGFDKEFSASLSIASSTIGPIIPPSIPAVVYAMVSGVSVGKLLMAGVIPGLLMGMVMMVFCYFISLRRGYPCRKWAGWRVYFRDLLYSSIRTFLPMLTPVILLGSLYGGIVTTTEASAVSVLYALFLGVIVYRTMGLEEFKKCLMSVVKACGCVTLVIPAAKVFSFVMTKANLQTAIYDLIIGFAGDSPALIVGCIMVLFLVLGCLSDPNVNIMVFVPMVLPLIEKAGLDPIHAGIVIIVNAMIGNITPPVGVVLMTTCSINKLRIEDVVKELWPWIVLLIGFLVFLILCPQVVLFLPNLMG
ncbi:MAG: TRAP transporter large permease [Clostridia bacterium]|nr:TRAP transporter large permease [Clostridia bacterium]